MQERDVGQVTFSFNVEDLQVSRYFYQRLGFEVVLSSDDGQWVMMVKDDTIIGLYEGIFTKNNMMFQTDDVRGVQEMLKGKDVEFLIEADLNTTGPAHAALVDPDGNQILIIQNPSPEDEPDALNS